MNASSEAPPLRCVLIGCGAIVQLQYVPAIQALGGVEVVGLIDPSAARADLIQHHFPGAQKLTGLDGVRADFAIVASPPAYHAEQAIEAMEAGFHVLCEKPMAATSQQARAMVDAAERTGKLLAIGLFRRFFPATQTVRDFIVNGTLGALRRYRISEGGEFDWPAVSATFFQRQHSTGGVLLDLGAHTLDLVRYWCGEPVKVEYEDDADGGLETACHVRFGHEQGVSGEIRLSREWKTANRYFIEFERGWLAWRPGESNRLEFGTHGGAYTGKLDLAGSATDWGEAGVGSPGLLYYQCFTAQVAQFIGAIAAGGKPTVTGEDGLANLRLIERCYGQKRATVAF